jgi:hypothetical protein
MIVRNGFDTRSEGSRWKIGQLACYHEGINRQRRNWFKLAGSGGGPTADRFPEYERQMISPDWKRFEELATAIQTELASDARVTPNAKLPGKSGALRQIDILIEQKAGQYDLRIVVDCKDYKNPVDIKDVESFLGLVSDVGAHKAQ